jgi:L-type amino acid transporter 9
LRMCLTEGNNGNPCLCHLKNSQELSPEEEEDYLQRGKFYNEKIEESEKLNQSIVKRKNSDVGLDSDSDADSKRVKLRREIDLIGAVLVIVGSQIGSGIFVSPKGVLEYSGSLAWSLICWTLAGVVATLGALCYAEVGTLINKSGGEYPILFAGYKHGHLPAFMFAWTCSTILKPSSFAILSMTCAKYTLSLISDDLPPLAEKMFALCIIWLVVAINSFSVKLTQRILKVFGYGKLISLAVIIIGGLTMVCLGKTDTSMFTTEKAFAHHTTGLSDIPSASLIGLALYQGLWAYDGWNQLNYVSEEVKNPGKNLPRAIIIAMITVTILYIMTNVSYLAILGVDGLLASDAVGTAFARQVLPGLDRVIPVMILTSVFGTCLISCFTASRVPFVAAREGQYPQILSMIHVTRMTPVPAVVFNGAIATLMVFPNDFETLVNYFSFCMWIFHTATCFATITLRRTMPIDRHPRLFQVPIAIAYIICIIGIYLILVPFLGMKVLLAPTCVNNHVFFSEVPVGLFHCLGLDRLWRCSLLHLPPRPFVQNDPTY